MKLCVFRYVKLCVYMCVYVHVCVGVCTCVYVERILRAVFGGAISSETTRILNLYACPLVDYLKVALRKPPA